jgi:LysM repeat protein
MDGSPACPFVAFEDDRDARADRPDHRHRCFAEGQPAPRALAHQEAYCLSSAFPVCPTFQAWARREAAQARSDRAADDAAAAGAMAASGPPPRDDARPPGGDPADPGSSGAADEWRGAPEDDVPIEARPHRNPPRDWAAPPPWASGTGAGAAGAAGLAGATGPSVGTPGGAGSIEPPAFVAPRSSESAGLAGSAADRLAGGESVADVSRPSSSTAPRPADLPSTGPDPELAGLVGGRPGSMGDDVGERDAALDGGRGAGYPPPTRGGRRPSVSSTRPSERAAAEPPPQRERVQGSGPSWEHSRRFEAYPTIKTRAGFGGMPALPRVLVLAGALGLAALGLFFLPAILGIGGGDGGATPSPSALASATPTPEPTPEPEPTAQVYVIKEGDTLSKIAKRNGVTVDQILEANPDTITDPNKISVGDEIIIPTPAPDEVTDGSTESTAP